MIGTRLAIVASLAACSAAAPATERPVTADPRAVTVDAAPPDAGVSAAVAAAPAWVFRYHTADRSETWTLRYTGGEAMLVVDSAQGSLRYLGSATDGASLAIDVSTGTAKMALDCKHEQRALSRKCNDTAGPAIDVLACYHPDFATPMPFGPEPGVEYVVDASCNGYRLVTP
jgi:hypothetical protein